MKHYDLLLIFKFFQGCHNKSRFIMVLKLFQGCHKKSKWHCLYFVRRLPTRPFTKSVILLFNFQNICKSRYNIFQKGFILPQLYRAYSSHPRDLSSRISLLSRNRNSCRISCSTDTGFRIWPDCQKIANPAPDIRLAGFPAQPYSHVAPPTSCH